MVSISFRCWGRRGNIRSLFSRSHYGRSKFHRKIGFHLFCSLGYFSLFEYASINHIAEMVLGMFILITCEIILFSFSNSIRQNHHLSNFLPVIFLKYFLFNFELSTDRRNQFFFFRKDNKFNIFTLLVWIPIPFSLLSMHS